MNRLGLIVASIMLSTAAMAQPRPMTQEMSCREVNSNVISRGAIVLGTGPNTYDRYVRSQAFCLSNEFARPAWVPTSDTPQCFVGYTCEDEIPLF
jgi:hypothetical protein